MFPMISISPIFSSLNTDTIKKVISEINKRSSRNVYSLIGSMLLASSSVYGENLLPFSEQFQMWKPVQDASIIADVSVDPFQKLSADLINESPNGKQPRIATTLKSPSSSFYTFSVYAKNNGTLNKMTLCFRVGSTILNYKTVNLKNSWTRFALVSKKKISADKLIVAEIYPGGFRSDGDNTHSITVADAQLERGTIATTYSAKPLNDSPSTPTPTVAATSTSIPTATPTSAAIFTSTFTPTRVATSTPQFTATSTPTSTSTAVATPTFTNTTAPTRTPTHTPTFTSTSTSTPTITPTSSTGFSFSSAFFDKSDLTRLLINQSLEPQKSAIDHVIAAANGGTTSVNLAASTGDCDRGNLDRATNQAYMRALAFVIKHDSSPSTADSFAAVARQQIMSIVGQIPDTTSGCELTFARHGLAIAEIARLIESKLSTQDKSAIENFFINFAFPASDRAAQKAQNWGYAADGSSYAMATYLKLGSGRSLKDATSKFISPDEGRRSARQNMIDRIAGSTRFQGGPCTNDTYYNGIRPNGAIPTELGRTSAVGCDAPYIPLVQEESSAATYTQASLMGAMRLAEMLRREGDPILFQPIQRLRAGEGTVTLESAFRYLLENPLNLQNDGRYLNADSNQLEQFEIALKVWNGPQMISKQLRLGRTDRVITPIEPGNLSNTSNMFLPPTAVYPDNP